MEINQPEYNTLKSNKHELHTTHSSYSESNSQRTSSIKTGQVLQGEIIDIRYNEVKLKLQPEQREVTAQIEGKLPLHIGQKASFLVTSQQSGSLTLKYMQLDNQNPLESTIDKALQASNLPKTDRNKSLVQELLNHRMPVDKQTLHTLIKLSLSNRDTAPLTLVLMLKNNISKTKENIAQFEAYQKGTHTLLNNLHTLMDEITSMTRKEGLSQENYILLQRELLDLLDPKPTHPTMGSSLETSLSEALSTEAYAKIMDHWREFSTIIESNKTIQASISSPDMYFDLLQKGSLSDTAGVNLLTNFVIQNNAFHTHNLDQIDLIRHTLFPFPLENLPQDITNSILELTDDISQILRDEGLIGTILNSEERNHLASLLSKINENNDDTSTAQLNQNRLDQIKAGTISTNDFFTIIKTLLTDKTVIIPIDLLQSVEYQKLFKAAIHGKWTLTPDKLQSLSKVEQFYHSLEEDITKLQHFNKIDSSLANTELIQGSAKNMQDNLQFMAELNRLFSCIQLPIQLRNQDAHADIYVLSKKKIKAITEDGFRVLLHLDLPSLGMTDIYLHMKNKSIHANFYLEKKETYQLISDHVSLLADALSKKGFHLQAVVKEAYEKFDFSRDFIDQDKINSEQELQRFTFDIRT